MKWKRNLGPWLVLGGIGVYLALFFAARLPSLEQHTGDVFRRGMFFIYLLLPDEQLAAWFGRPAELSLLDRLPVLAIAAAILAWGFGLGWLAMTWIGARRRLTRLEVFVFSTAVGLNLVSTYVLLVGLLGLLGNVLVFAVPAALTLAAVGRLRWRRRTAHEAGRGRPREQGEKSGGGPGSTPPGRDDWLSPRWLWLGAPFVLAILLGSMLPPIEFDVREYHLEVPKEFFQQGRIGFLPHNVYGNMAMGSEMLSLLAMVIAHDWWLGALAGKTVIGAFATLTALGLLAAGRRFLSPSAGVIAAVLYISTPWVAQVSSLGLVEGAEACYWFLAVYALLLWQASPGREPGAATGGPGHAGRPGGSPPAGPARPAGLMLAGYLAGGAVAAKYPAAVFVFLPLAVWVRFVARSEGGRPISAARKSGAFPRRWPNWRDRWKPAGVFVLAAAVGCGLWFGKNWVLTGNPTYPLLYKVFDSPHWSPEKNQKWNRAHRPHDFSPGAALEAAGRVVLRSEWLSPLLMPLAGLAVLGVFFPPVGKGTVPLAPRENRGGPQPAREFPRRLAACLALYVVYVVAAWWLLTHRIDRFWIPVLPLVALLAGQGAGWRPRRAWRLVLPGLLVVTSLFNFLVVTSVAGGDNRYFVALARLRRDPDRIDPWHRYFNAKAMPGRVLLVGDAQPFDLEVPVAYNTVFDDSIFEQLAAGRSPDEVRRALGDRDITQIYVDWGEIARYRSAGNYGFTDFVQPDVFERLVGAGVLRPLPAIKDHPGRAYEVVGNATR